MPEVSKYSELLQFRPKKWWDPVPFWYIDRLELPVLSRLVQVQIEFEQSVLKAQVEANHRVQEILKEMNVG